MNAPLASLSLDLDNKWSYLKTHGDPGWEAYPSYLGRVVPRTLEMLDSLDLKITFFVVGQDAALSQNHQPLAEIAAAGHEIGNHSFHHEPWLHLYQPEQIDQELSDAEHAIEAATGAHPRGFRGPGFSFSPEVLRCLAIRGYQYDASTLPTFLGPMARAYYFFTAKLDDEMRAERKLLFGRFPEGFRPVAPYRWSIDNDAHSLVEVPVTTIPVVRTPFHVSYLLYLASYSRKLAWAYWRYAIGSCRLFGVAPSLLLHPLDFLSGDEEPDLDFFPAMRMPGVEKRAFVGEILADFAARYHVVSMEEFVAIHSIDKVRHVSVPAEQAATAEAAHDSEAMESTP